ncbi:hypothetical protein SAMN02745121_08925 [Nannocystis exedens]|uniref:DUF2169 domain-containing protein n=2 Tax=Nannocystis exedens TaxID=54 RepID=A0A1I2IT86_9BACT|nr:hypothetical protein NAEX_01216 [Nannocystis exedens]SFF44833.1 hypothetical protein SAMN02745121_08925 [Nannocystis exedens]
MQPQLVLDGQGEERLLLVMKGSFELDGEVLRPTYAAVVLADQYRGDPASTSLVAASEVVLFKPLPDLLLSGHAFPEERGGTTGAVSFRVGNWSKDALVFGDRVWMRGVTGLHPSAPQPFERIPLVYERAFGGADLARTSPLGCPENPVGVGMVDCRSGGPVPNLEHPRHRLSAAGDRPPSRAFGPIPPHWQPRRSFHGTFDADWQRTRMPLPPLDADPRAAQVAPPDQVLPHALEGGEPVEIRGVRQDGRWLRFHVPRLRVRVTVHDGRCVRELPTALDTLHVDADALRLDLTWRAHVSVHDGIDNLAWVRIDAEEAPHG